MKHDSKIRDIAITLSFEKHMSTKEINQELKKAMQDPLNPADRRDAAIILSVMNEEFDVERLNLNLKRAKLKEIYIPFTRIYE